MERLNTPDLETERLILRKFRMEDIDALFSIYSEREVNTYLLWFPLTSLHEAEQLFVNEYEKAYGQSRGYRYAVCLKTDHIPIGYVHLSTDDSYDLGCGLSKRFWHRGITVEASRSVLICREPQPEFFGENDRIRDLNELLDILETV